VVEVLREPGDLLVVAGVCGGFAGGVFEVGDVLVGGGELVFEADDAGGGGQRREPS
jgi:hypothetical protein